MIKEFEYLKNILEHVMQGIVMFDGSRNLVAWNKRYQQVLRFPDGFLMPGMSNREMTLFIAKRGDFGEGDPEKLADDRINMLWEGGQDQAEITVAGENTYEVLFERTNDEGLVVSYTDITERKQAERILRDSEQRFRTLYHQSPLGVLLEDYSSVKEWIDRLVREGVTDFRKYFQEHENELMDAIMGIRLLDANDTLIEMYGATSFEEYHEYEDNFDIWKDSDWRDFYISEIAALAEGESTYTKEFRDRKIDKSGIEIRCTTRVVQGRENDWSEIISTHEDVSERKQAERDLRASEERFRNYTETSSDYYWEMDENLRVSALSERFSEVSGVSIDEVIGKTSEEIGNPNIDPETREPYLADLAAHKPIVNYVHSRTHPNGKTVWLSSNAVPVFDDSGDFKGYRGTTKNISVRMSAENARQKSTQILREAIESLEEGFVFYDENDRLVVANSTYKKMYPAQIEIQPGIKFEDAIRLSVYAGEVPAAIGNEEEWITERLKQHRKQAANSEQNLSDGRWVKVSEQRTSDGGTVGIRTDISELKKTESALRESEEKFRTLAEIGNDWFWQTDSEHNLVSYRGYREIPGLPKKGATGIPRWENASKRDLLDDEKWARHKLQLNAHEKFRDFEFELKANPPEWVRVSGDPMFDEDGKFLGYQGIATIITSRKTAEEQLRLAHDQLELRVHERTEQLRGEVEERKRIQQDLIQAHEIADAANRAKSDLMANMSHELRTPLNAIIGFSDSMKQEIFGPVGDEKYREYLEDIHLSGQHLLELINDILDVSAIEAGALELHEENVSMKDIVEASIRLIRHRADEGKVILNRSIDPKLPLIYCDERRVKQVLLNLLSNAVKFTPEDGEVSVSSRINGNSTLSISVSDTGIGMAEEEIEKALSAFGQLDSGLNRKHEGTGLGLPLTKGLMELHGGTLEIRSKKDHGTEITVTFPKDRVI